MARSHWIVGGLDALDVYVCFEVALGLIAKELCSLVSVQAAAAEVVRAR